MSTFQFLVVEGESLVFEVFLPGQSSTALHVSPGRISEQIVEQIEAFKIFSQDRVHLHHFHLQVVFMKTQMSASPTSQHASVSSSTPALQLRLLNWVLVYNGEVRDHFLIGHVCNERRELTPGSESTQSRRFLSPLCGFVHRRCFFCDESATKSRLSSAYLTLERFVLGSCSASLTPRLTLFHCFCYWFHEVLWE